MTEEAAPQFTHFSSANGELPKDYYVEMGRALYRWSQLESTSASLAASIMGLPWLEAVGRLRGGTGFKTKNIFQQLSAAATRKAAGPSALAAIDRAQKLYEQRKELFHSVWGHATGPGKSAVAILEWSATDYSNFRPIKLQEIASFSSECLAVSELLMTHAIPLFHGAKAFGIDDEDGLPKGIDN